MPISVDCLHCRKRLGISEHMLNQRVRCPHCAAVVTISLRAAVARLHSAPEPPTAPPPPASAPAVETDRLKKQILIPVIGLIVTGAGTTLMGLMFLSALLFPEMMGEPLPRDPLEVTLSVLFMILTLAMGIVTLYGAIKMQRRESYALAMTAAIVAMIPWYCCILGLPFGIWAIIVLRRPAVKAFFAAGRTD